MIQFGASLPNDTENQWRYQLDRFVAENQQPLAALAWGLIQEWGDTKEVLGIDLEPSPHFIRCSPEAIEQLNSKLDRKIQEILGILANYKPQEEVAIIAIAKGQVKLIYYQTNPTPIDCFRQYSGNLDDLVEQLEKLMIQQIKL